MIQHLQLIISNPFGRFFFFDTNDIGRDKIRTHNLGVNFFCRLQNQNEKKNFPEHPIRRLVYPRPVSPYEMAQGPI